MLCVEFASVRGGSFGVPSQVFLNAIVLSIMRMPITAVILILVLVLNINSMTCNPPQIYRLIPDTV